MVAGIIAIALEMASCGCTQIATIEPQTTISTEISEAWHPYECLQMDEDVQLLIHEVVEENYPMIDESVVMALVFEESAGQFLMAKSGSGAVGYAQLRPELFWCRAQELNTSVWTEYGNILIATDYLVELLDRYDDLAYCLDIYRGGECFAKKNANSGVMSDYSKKIIELSDLIQEERK